MIEIWMENHLVSDRYYNAQIWLRSVTNNVRCTELLAPNTRFCVVLGNLRLVHGMWCYGQTILLYI